MFSSVTKISSTLNTHSLPSSSSSLPSISHSLFLRNTPQLSECQPSMTSWIVHNSMPLPESSFFFAYTFSDKGSCRWTFDQIYDLQRFTLQDVLHLQSLFAKYTLSSSITWNDLLGLDLYMVLKKIGAFFSLEEGNALLKKWACSYLSSSVALVMDFQGGKGKLNLDSHENYKEKLEKFSQEFQEKIDSAALVDNSKICAPKSMTTKNAKKRFFKAEQQRLQEERKRAFMDLVEEWNTTAKLLIKFLSVSNPAHALTERTIECHLQANQLDPTNLEESIIAIKHLHSYMQMHIDGYEGLMLEQSLLLFPLPPFCQQLLPIIQAALETSDLDQILGHCSLAREIIIQIQESLKQQIPIAIQELDQGSSGKLRYSQWSQRHGFLSPLQMDSISFTNLLKHRKFYLFYLKVLCCDYEGVIEKVMAILNPEFNGNLSHAIRMANLIDQYVSSRSAGFSPPIINPLIRLMERSDKELLESFSDTAINQYNLIKLQANPACDQFYGELKSAVDEIFNRFVIENGKIRFELNEGSPLPEEVLEICRAFTLLHDLGIVLRKIPSDSSDLDILPAAFFDLFILADQEKDPITPSEPELIRDIPVSLSPKSLIVETTTDFSPRLAILTDPKETFVSSESLETIDKISFNGTPSLEIDSVQEESAKKLPRLSTHSDADIGHVSIVNSSPVLKPHSKKSSVPTSPPLSRVPVLTAEAQASVSISESQAEALEDILHTTKRAKIEKILGQLGLKPIPCRGGHTKWRDPSGQFGQTVTSGREVPIGTRRAIVEQLRTPSSHLKV